jgi:hypothetical protein
MLNEKKISCISFRYANLKFIVTQYEKALDFHFFLILVSFFINIFFLNDRYRLLRVLRMMERKEM